MIIDAMKATTPPFPEEILDQLRAMGARIRQARISRSLRQEDLAARSSLSVTAIKAVEKGEPSTGLGTYLRVLWSMGLNRELDLLADPAIDRDGMALQFSLSSKRVSVARKVSNDF